MERAEKEIARQIGSQTRSPIQTDESYISTSYSVSLPRLVTVLDGAAPQPQASLLPQPQGISSLFQSFCSLSEE